MDFITQNQELVAIVVAIALFVYWYNRRPDKDGRLPDLAITISKIENLILNELEFDEKSKISNERDAQKYLYEFLEERILHVQQHRSIGGTTSKTIDFDVGCGRVGIEIKMGKSAFKNAERNRMFGQVNEYLETEYGNDNLLLLFFCDEKTIKERVHHTAIREQFEERDVRIHFLPI